MFLTLTIWDYKQFAKATGAHVTAISSSSSKRDDAAKLGADAYLDTSDEEAVKAAFSTLDLIICTSYQDNMPLKEVYLPLLRPLGNIVRFSTGSFPATHYYYDPR